MIKKHAKHDFDPCGSLCPWLFSTFSSCLSSLFCSLKALVELFAMLCDCNRESLATESSKRPNNTRFNVQLPNRQMLYGRFFGSLTLLLNILDQMCWPFRTSHQLGAKFRTFNAEGEGTPKLNHRC